MALPAQTKYIFLSVLFVLASINFTRTALEILENSKRLDTLEEEVSVMETKRNDLQNAVSYKQTDTFIEEKARNDLSLIKPGEKVYILPESLKEEVSNELILGVKSAALEAESSNLSKWLALVIK